MSTAERTVEFHVPWQTIFRLLIAGALVWCAIRLTTFLQLALMTIVLAVTLDPPVQWLERRHVPRWIGACLVVFGLAAVLFAFVWLASAELIEQTRLVGTRLQEAERVIRSRVPASWRDFFTTRHAEESFRAYVDSAGIQLAEGTARVFTLFALAGILTLYLLIEWRKTYAWLLAFVPLPARPKVERTAIECQRVIFGYLAGNVVTSVFAGVFVYASLVILHVPSAFLFAVLAGIFDFVPVLGFLVSGVPAVAMALTVSPAAAVGVVLLYLAYHAIENFLIAPYVYGGQLRLSNVAIVVAFAVGAELAGVVGALIALPIAAAYPAVERIWLRQQLGEEVVREHRAIEQAATTKEGP